MIWKSYSCSFAKWPCCQTTFYRFLFMVMDFYCSQPWTEKLHFAVDSAKYKELWMFSYACIICINVTPSKAQETSQKRWEDHKHQRPEKRDVKCSPLDTTRLCIHGVTAAVVTGTRPVQDQANQHSNLDWEGPKAPFLVKEVLAVDGFWKKKSQTSFGGYSCSCPKGWLHPRVDMESTNLPQGY